MRTYQFTSSATEAMCDLAVIQLRKDGFNAYRETNTLHTDASVFQIAMATGNANRIIELPIN